ENAGEGQDWAYVTVSGYRSEERGVGKAGNTTSGLTLNANATQDSILFGNIGNDILNGGAGNDQFAGGGGNDTIHAGAGNDTLGTGAGNDVLDGGMGADVMVGRQGNDSYFVDNLGDQIVEAAGEGQDWAYVTVSGY